jgi:hypothetical protein
MTSRSQVSSAQATLTAQANQSSQADSGVLDFLAALQVGLNSSATLQQSQRPRQQPPVVATSAMPPGWVDCTCPSQHASMGRMINSALYHPEGPHCK